jgi:ABC-type uncharacterized transport system auxiliary subunit
MKRSFCLLAILCVVLTSCVSGKPIRYYRIEFPAAPAAAATTSQMTLAVGAIDCPPLLRDGRILYQVGDHEVGAYEYHRWVETPDRMIQNSLVRLLRSSGKYPSVDIQRSGVQADYIVAGKIYEFSEVDKPEIHTRVSLEIEVREGKSGRVVWSRPYKQEDPVRGKEVSDVVESLDRNLRQGLSGIVAEMDQYLGLRNRGL